MKFKSLNLTAGRLLEVLETFRFPVLPTQPHPQSLPTLLSGSLKWEPRNEGCPLPPNSWGFRSSLKTPRFLRSIRLSKALYCTVQFSSLRCSVIQWHSSTTRTRQQGTHVVVAVWLCVHVYTPTQSCSVAMTTWYPCSYFLTDTQSVTIVHKSNRWLWKSKKGFPETPIRL